METTFCEKLALLNGGTIALTVTAVICGGLHQRTVHKHILPAGIVCFNQPLRTCIFPAQERSSNEKVIKTWLRGFMLPPAASLPDSTGLWHFYRRGSSTGICAPADFFCGMRGTILKEVIGIFAIRMFMKRSS